MERGVWGWPKVWYQTLQHPSPYIFIKNYMYIYHYIGKVGKWLYN